MRDGAGSNLLLATSLPHVYCITQSFMVVIKQPRKGIRKGKSSSCLTLWKLQFMLTAPVIVVLVTREFTIARGVWLNKPAHLAVVAEKERTRGRE